MKQLILVISLSLFIYPTACVYAVPNQPSKSKPKMGAITNPEVRRINLRIRIQTKLIMLGVKKGNLTKKQAKTLEESLTTIRQKELAFFKQNGKPDLTPTQQNQLDKLLDKNSAVLGETTSSSK